MSKEEIEKAKENTKYIIEYIDPLKGFKDFDYGDIDILLQYIDQLEQENSKQSKMIDLMAGSINSYDSQLSISKYKDRKDVKRHYEEYFEKKVEGK